MLTQPRQTALYQTHVGLGAKMSPFGGFLMPIVYSSILEEHNAVRTAVGMFDLSHMGQFIASGDAVAPWLDGLTVNDVASMRPNQARYNIFTNEAGGAHDDVIIYRLRGALAHRCERIQHRQDVGFAFWLETRRGEP